MNTTIPLRHRGTRRWPWRRSSDSRTSTTRSATLTRPPSPSDLSVVPLPAGRQHPFLGPPRAIPGISSEPAAAILTFDGTAFTFNTGVSDVLDSTATITSSGQLQLTSEVGGSTCEAGDEGLYDYSFSNGGTQTDDHRDR